MKPPHCRKRPEEIIEQGSAYVKISSCHPTQQHVCQLLAEILSKETPCLTLCIICYHQFIQLTNPYACSTLGPTKPVSLETCLWASQTQNSGHVCTLVSVTAEEPAEINHEAWRELEDIFLGTRWASVSECISQKCSPWQLVTVK